MHAHPPRRRRSCVGCLLHHPFTVGLTFVALILWLNQVVRGAIALAAAQPPDLLGSGKTARSSAPTPSPPRPPEAPLPSSLT